MSHVEFSAPDVQHTVIVDNTPPAPTDHIPLGPKPPVGSAANPNMRMVAVKPIPAKMNSPFLRRSGNAGSRLVTSGTNVYVPGLGAAGVGEVIYPHLTSSSHLTSPHISSHLTSPHISSHLTSPHMPALTLSRAGTSLLRDTLATTSSPSIIERKRFGSSDEFDYDLDKRQRRDKGGARGLRHFSMKVCEKVQEKGVTTYNEVADELVQEVAASEDGGDSGMVAAYDQKNIRRRVYDALNVLMAMNIIAKDRKEISWIGLPTNPSQEAATLQHEIRKTGERLAMKKKRLFEMLVHYITMRNLTDRNRNIEALGRSPDDHTKIPLPFIIINTDEKTKIDCNISSDKHEYLFNFDNAFEIYDDVEVAKRIDSLSLALHKGQASEEAQEKAKALLAHQFHQYIDQLTESGIPGTKYSSYYDQTTNMWHHQAQSGQKIIPGKDKGDDGDDEGDDDDDNVEDEDDEDSRGSSLQ